MEKSSQMHHRHSLVLKKRVVRQNITNGTMSMSGMKLCASPLLPLFMAAALLNMQPVLQETDQIHDILLRLSKYIHTTHPC